MEVSVLGRFGGSRVMNVWHYKLAGAGAVIVDGDAAQVALQAVIQPAVNGVLQLYRNYSNEACDWQHVRYQWTDPLRYSAKMVDVGNGPGIEVNQPLPANVSAVATLKGELAGAAGRGRKHFTALSVSDVNGSVISLALFPNLAPILNKMGQVIDLGALAVGASLIPIIYHRDNAALSEPWSEYEFQETARVMRRRTLGVGE